MSTSLSAIGGLLTGGPTAIIVKATLVLASTAIAAIVLRRASAAFRHLIWLLGLTACAALALLSPAAPSIDVDIPVTTLRRPTQSIFERPVTITERSRRAATTIVGIPSGESLPVAVTVASSSIDAEGRPHLSSLLVSSGPLEAPIATSALRGRL